MVVTWLCVYSFQQTEFADMYLTLFELLQANVVHR